MRDVRLPAEPVTEPDALANDEAISPAQVRAPVQARPAATAPAPATTPAPRKSRRRWLMLSLPLLMALGGGYVWLSSGR